MIFMMIFATIIVKLFAILFILNYMFKLYLTK